MPGSCDRCGAPLIEIEHHGNRLIGCLACNRWRGNKSAFVVELEAEVWEALGKLAHFTKWTLAIKRLELPRTRPSSVEFPAKQLNAESVTPRCGALGAFLH
jgi:hypothetical protein